MTVYYLIFDLKRLANNHLVYLETGSAVHSQLQRETAKKMWSHLLINYPNAPIYTDNLSGVNIPDLYKSKVKVVGEQTQTDQTLLYQIITGELTEGIVIFSNIYSIKCAYAFKMHYELNNLIIIDHNAIIVCNNKVPFYEICERAGVAYPPTWLISPHTYQNWSSNPEAFAIHKHHESLTSASGWIIKPPDGTRGEGAAFCTDKQLPSVLKYLNVRTGECPLKGELRFSEFWGPKNKSKEIFEIEKMWPFLLQKMISGVNDKNIESTYRVVVAIKTNDRGIVDTCEVLEIIQKDPMVLPGEKRSDTVISLTKDVATECNYSKPYITILKQTDPVYQAIAQAVGNDMRKLMPVFYNFNLSHSWMQKTVIDKDYQSNNNNDTSINYKPIDLDKPHDYLIHVIEKIERYNFEKYDDSVIKMLVNILAGNVQIHRKLLTLVFTHGYFSSMTRPLPNFARTDNLFQVIVNFILTETDDSVLQYVGSLAVETIEFHNTMEQRNDASANPYISKLLLDKTTIERMYHIIAITKRQLHELHPSHFSLSHHPILNKFYGLWSDIAYFPCDKNDGKKLIARNQIIGGSYKF